MKQYLLLLKSSDFTKNGNVWTSNPINLYSNNQYSNYSYSRSAFGLNLIGDRTYVGTELTSPSYGSQSTPVSSNAVYKTDVGEVVYEAATPDVIRFIDTTSRIDILNYKYTFTNISGTIVPTMSITVYESDDGKNPWLRSATAVDSNVLLIRNSKQYIKLELDITAESINLNNIGLVLYLEIGIHDPISPVISNSVKNVAKRFPTWTAIFEDSIDQATPELYIPQSTGGKFLTALLQENLERFNSLVEINDVNSYINSANEEMLSWMYVSYNVPQNINQITGDSINLARSSGLVDILNGRETDYSFYYNPVTKQFITLRKFNRLVINGSLYEQEPINIFNDFDEFGSRVGLPRLYLESNSNYKKRILDVTQNMPGVSLEAFKRTVRRELDLWRAYGSTPDSNFIGATPEVLEISDIEKSTPYFTESGKPEKQFRNFVEEINTKYPSNIGFIRWGDGVWDYAGKTGEGVARVPAVYDSVASPIGNYYSPGVGDFDDLKISMFPQESATTSFNGYINISGYRTTNVDYIYPPIFVDYSWYFGYLRTVSNTEANKVGVALVYEICLPPHDNYATPSVYYANLNYNNRSDFYVTNYYLSTSNSSPEYSYINIYNNEGISEIEFRHKVFGELYYNTTTNPTTNGINIYDAASVNVYFGQQWNQNTQSYTTVAASNYRVSFTKPGSQYIVNPTTGSGMSLATPHMHPNNLELKIGSTKYLTKQELQFSDHIVGSKIVINGINDLKTTSSATINTSRLISAMALPADATPLYLYIEAATPSNLTYYGSSKIRSEQGGYSVDPISGDSFLIPSSPSISWRPYNKAGSATSTPSYFNKAIFNLSSTPDHIRVSSNNTGTYPFSRQNYTAFDVSSTPSIFYGFIDEFGNAHKNESEYSKTFVTSDDYLSSIVLSRKSFSLSTPTYVIDDIKFITNKDFIEVSSKNNIELINRLNSAFETNSSINVDLHAIRDDIKNARYLIGINTGMFSMNEKDRYIYNTPITNSYTGKFFKLTLSNQPRMGAPIIAKVNDKEYRNIVFEDSATPGKMSFWNTETVYGGRGKSIYLAYQNIKNASVKDLYTGISLFKNLATSSNVLSPFNQSTPLIEDREYEVTYYVNDAFYVDKEVYNSSSDNYESIIYFSSTPSTNSSYSITYESAYKNKFIDTELTVNEFDAPIEEGFIYIDENSYNFNRLETYLSPGYVTDSGGDMMFLSIISYDENNNLKPRQTFLVSSNSLAVVSDSSNVSINVNKSAYVTTNENGFATIGLKYNGAYPATLRSDSITITGIGAATPSGNTNSQSQGYKKVISYDIFRNIPFSLELKASPVQMIVSADGKTNIPIVGRVYWRGVPLKATINLAWNKARTLKDLFAATTTNSITTDSEGRFIIDSIVSEPNTNPGQWFVRVQITNTAQQIKALLPANEVSAASDITITGDIVYWNEKYDNVHFANEELPFAYNFIFAKQDKSELIATPNFVYSHYDSLSIKSTNSTPNWTPPKWVALRRFDQYQMGIFGSTPNYIKDFSSVRPDSREE